MMAARTWLDAELGRLFDNGTELEYLGGLNFIGFTITRDDANNRWTIEVTGGGASSSDDVSNESTVTGATVTDALDAIDAALAALDSDDIANASGVSGASVSDALDTLEAAIVGGGVPSTTQVIAGAGLTGGGDLSTDRTFDIVAANGTITVNADSIQVGTVGNTNFADNTLALARLANATAQFNIIGRKTGSAGAWENCTRSELGLALSAQQVIAGAGLTGGGDLSADRTLNVVANADGTIVVNANDIQVGTLVAGNYANNTIALARLVNATASPRFLMRTTASAGAWEEGTAANVLSGLSGGTIAALTVTALTTTTVNGATPAAPAQGTAITTTATVNIANGSRYQVTAASAYTITLGTSGSPADGDTVEFECTNALANAITVTNGGTGGGNIGISGGMPAGVKALYTYYYDGTATAWKYGGRQRIA